MSHEKANPKLPVILRSIAAVTSGTSAVAAYPIASEMFGQVAGGVIVSSCAAAIFAGWHYVGTESTLANAGETHSQYKDIVYRVLAGSVSVLFASAMVAGIHASANQEKTITQAQTATAADTLYRQQEGSRISTLGKLTEELRVTSKRKNPSEYANLQAQIKILSVPTVRQKTARQQAPSKVSDVYSWAVAAAFEVITPALLILAGLFGRRQTHQLVSTQTPVSASAAAVDAVVTPVDAPTQVIENIELTQLTDAPTASTQAAVTKVSVNDIQDALAAQQVATNDDGNVTASAVEAHTQCTSRQARTAISTATSNGYLIKTGSGNTTRYSYPASNIRRIK